MLQSSRPAAGTLTVVSPFDGRELDQIPTAGVDHVEDALTVANATFRDRSKWLPIPERLNILEKTAHIMSSQIEELAVLAASEGGKPLADSRAEVVRAINGVQLCAETLRSHHGNVIPLGTTPATTGRLAFTQYNIRQNQRCIDGMI